MPRKNKQTDAPIGTPKSRRLTPVEIEIFLEEIVKAGGNVSRACEKCKVTRSTIYSMREKPEFEVRFQEAKERAVDALEDEAIRRAFEGVEEPVGFYMGVSLETRTNYSDSLIQFLLKGARPFKYRERISTENVNMDADKGENAEAVRAEILKKLNGGRA